MKTDFDVVIAGGGPAGLLLASELGKHFRVLVSERGCLGHTSKFWVTTRRRLARHSLDDCCAWSASAVSLGTYLGGRAIAAGDLVVTNEELLLKTLAKRCRDLGVVIVEHSEIMGCQYPGARVDVLTRSGSISTRLLVDATGGQSRFGANDGKPDLSGFFTVYGGHVTHLRSLCDEIVLGYVPSSGPPTPILEVVPTGPDSAFFVLVLATSGYLEPGELSDTFQSHLTDNRFFAVTDRTEFRIKLGSIPIGKPVSPTRPGLLFYGEAALVQPPLVGSAFNEILEHNQMAALQVMRHLSRNTEGVASVQVQYPRLKRANDCIQRKLVDRIIDADAYSCDAISRQLSALDPRALFRLLSNELRAHDVVSLLYNLWSSPGPTRIHQQPKGAATDPRIATD